MIIEAALFWTWAHFMAHFGIAAGYGMAVSRTNYALGRLMRMSLWTRIFGMGFFVFCGATHLGLALKISDSPVITATDELQLISIWGFLLFLLLDVRRTVVRMSNALDAIQFEYDGIAIVSEERRKQAIEEGWATPTQVGSIVVATMEFALFGKEDQPSVSQPAQDE